MQFCRRPNRYEQGRQAACAGLFGHILKPFGARPFTSGASSASVRGANESLREFHVKNPAWGQVGTVIVL